MRHILHFLGIAKEIARSHVQILQMKISHQGLLVSVVDQIDQMIDFHLRIGDLLLVDGRRNRSPEFLPVIAAAPVVSWRHVIRERQRWKTTLHFRPRLLS